MDFPGPVKFLVSALHSLTRDLADPSNVQSKSGVEGLYFACSLWTKNYLVQSHCMLECGVSASFRQQCQNK